VGVDLPETWVGHQTATACSLRRDTGAVVHRGETVGHIHLAGYEHRDTMALDSSCRLYLGTENGMQTAVLGDGQAAVVAEGLPGQAVRAISPSPVTPGEAFVGCGVRGSGLYRTTDGGHTYTSLGFDDEWVWGLSRHPTDPERLYVGTEPPGLWVSTDSGSSFERVDGIETLPSRENWFFFHPPFEAGHVHGISIHPDRPEQVFAGVEHGAIIYSRDGGVTWAESLAAEDIHRVAIHPDDPDRVFVAAGSGLYRSVDAGETWEQVPALAGEYAHAIEFDPRSPERLYVYVATDGAPLYRSDDGGDSWVKVGDGLPDARAADTLRLLPGDPDAVVYAGETDDGSRLFLSRDAGESWRRLALELPMVWRLAVADGGGSKR